MFDIVKLMRPGLAAAVLLGTAASASATSLVKLSNDDLAHIADVIVVGDVREVAFEREGSVLVTRTEVRVAETWKGDVEPGTIIDVLEAGGRDGARAMDVQGSAGYLKNERVVLFLQARETRRGYLTIGMFQGKFTLVPTREGAVQLTRLIVPMIERGKVFDARTVSRMRVDDSADFSAFSQKVKDVVRADREAGTVGKNLPQYKGIGR